MSQVHYTLFKTYYRTRFNFVHTISLTNEIATINIFPVCSVTWH